MPSPQDDLAAAFERLDEWAGGEVEVRLFGGAPLSHLRARGTLYRDSGVNGVSGDGDLELHFADGVFERATLRPDVIQRALDGGWEIESSLILRGAAGGDVLVSRSVPAPNEEAVLAEASEATALTSPDYRAAIAEEIKTWRSLGMDDEQIAEALGVDLEDFE